jgi:hypothetical protein
MLDSFTFRPHYGLGNGKILFIGSQFLLAFFYDGNWHQHGTMPGKKPSQLKRWITTLVVQGHCNGLSNTTQPGNIGHIS